MILIKRFYYVSVSGAFYGYCDGWNGVGITSTLLFRLHLLWMYHEKNSTRILCETVISHDRKGFYEAEGGKGWPYGY